MTKHPTYIAIDNAVAILTTPARPSIVPKRAPSFIRLGDHIRAVHFCRHCFARPVPSSGEICETCRSRNLPEWEGIRAAGARIVKGFRLEINQRMRSL